jgi:hypothetical protein
MPVDWLLLFYGTDTSRGLLAKAHAGPYHAELREISMWWVGPLARCPRASSLWTITGDDESNDDHRERHADEGRERSTGACP